VISNNRNLFGGHGIVRCEASNNGEYYTVWEAVKILKEKKGTLTLFSLHNIFVKHRKRHPPLFLGSYYTIWRICNKWDAAGIMPIPGSDGITRGRPPKVSHQRQNYVMNSQIDNSLGQIETIKDTSAKIQKVQKEDDIV